MGNAELKGRFATSDEDGAELFIYVASPNAVFNKDTKVKSADGPNGRKYVGDVMFKKAGMTKTVGVKLRAKGNKSRPKNTKKDETDQLIVVLETPGNPKPETTTIKVDIVEREYVEEVKD